MEGKRVKVPDEETDIVCDQKIFCSNGGSIGGIRNASNGKRNQYGRKD